MKTSPAISINEKCHSHQRFLASNVNEGPQTDPVVHASTPRVIAKELEGCKKQSEKGNRLVTDS